MMLRSFDVGRLVMVNCSDDDVGRLVIAIGGND